MEMLKGEITSIASPVSFDGVVYFSHGGYSPFDPTNGPRVMGMDGKTGALLFDARPDIDSWTQYSPYSGGVSASYILAGGNIYLFENTGSCLLFKPGRTFTPVRKNVFEGDLIISTPYLEGRRIYLRGNKNVYCIGEK